MYEPSEQEIREAVSELAMENYILRKKLEKVQESENNYLNLYLDETNKVSRLEKEFEEIKRAAIQPTKAI